MIFISAQPDEYYFLWQLKLQLFNFSSLGIKPEFIHVLVSFDPKKGLNKDFEELFESNKLAKFFAYPDTRLANNYTPSFRPHILSKHFQVNPWLECTEIFYHDSDIVFSALPDFKSLISGNSWYTSDTRSYLDSNYIKQTAGELIFNQMCDIIGVSPKVVEERDSHAGGAQYLMKKVPSEFWNKVEKDCEKMFDLLHEHNGKAGFCRRDLHEHRIQSWCTDMWCIYYNALYFNIDFKIHEELKFSWAGSSIELWKENKILHYTGAINKDDKTTFRKANYLQHEPFYDDFTLINKESCSYPLVKIINAYVEAQNIHREDLHDFTFLISVKIDSPDRLENLIASTKYLSRFFAASFLVLEIDDFQKINPAHLPPDIEYEFIQDSNEKLYRTHYNNLMITKAFTKNIVIYDCDVIIPKEQIVQAAQLLRNNKASMVSPYDGSFIGISELLKAMFLKLLDPELFVVNAKKIPSSIMRSYGGATFINKEHFVLAGMDNENITSWGPEDIERVKRMQILGYKVKRVKGNLYHLPHRRGNNSSYENTAEHEKLMNEYLKVCSFNKCELSKYVESWNWISENLYISKILNGQN